MAFDPSPYYTYESYYGSLAMEQFEDEDHQPIQGIGVMKIDGERISAGGCWVGKHMLPGGHSNYIPTYALTIYAYPPIGDEHMHAFSDSIKNDLLAQTKLKVIRDYLEPNFLENTGWIEFLVGVRQYV